MSRPIFGYTSDGQEIPSILNALEEVDQLIKDETISLRDAADFIYTMTGKSISHVGLRERLSKGVYIGKKEKSLLNPER